MPARPARNRAHWLKLLHQWHWISSALCLAGLLMFAVTGLTLNNAGWFEGNVQTVQVARQLPANLLQQASQLAIRDDGITAPLPPALEAWLDDDLNIKVAGRPAEYRPDEIYVSLPEPGGDAWLAINLGNGSLEYERTQRGWVAYFNDLHKGRHTGLAWKWFIDVFSLACLIFAITGLFLLKLHGKHRPLTWPLTGMGLVMPLVLMLLWVH